MTRHIQKEAAMGPLDPLMGIVDLARVLATSRRTIERLRAAGRFPKPDCHVGSMPRWRPEAVRDWIEKGGAA